MAFKKVLTVFGSTGSQGGSVIDTVLSRPELQQMYALRGVTRNTSSPKSQALAAKGVEMVQGELSDLESLKNAVAGSYGAFGVTDFWAVMNKDVEMQQGKNIFEAVKSAGVKHYIWSSLPYAAKLTNGRLMHVDHFDSKAIVEEYVESNKGDMIVSFVMPAMYITFAKTMQLINPVNGVPTLSMPFPSDSIAWPLIEPRRDMGKYVMGVFEGGAAANGVRVHAVSTWTTPKEVVESLSKASGKTVEFKSIAAEQFASFLPDAISNEITETMLLIGDHNYYGNDAKDKQAESDKWILPGSDKISYPQWAKQSAPFNL
ncbi:hypothetical protein M433DRAFT_106733 [Acidomyces richmondensis BFW]|nr:MAG: hypothetical protein FE78DRAFT_165889 [Acidomyces sp. 'richmondensis']KYG46226.1 hypothetical protein M433DRAFT_106733 [Acidomyces richmondensis BFW]